MEFRRLLISFHEEKLMGWMPNLNKLDEQLAQAREKQAAIAARKARNDGDLKDAYIKMKDEGTYTLRILPTWRRATHQAEQPST